MSSLPVRKGRVTGAGPGSDLAASSGQWALVRPEYRYHAPRRIFVLDVAARWIG